MAEKPTNAPNNAQTTRIAQWLDAIGDVDQEGRQRGSPYWCGQTSTFIE